MVEALCAALILAAASAGCEGAIYGAAGAVYAAEGCDRMCGENHLRCNPETGLCEPHPCDEGCPPGTVCDDLRDECVLVDS
jgi:hypothetical protein